MIVEFIDANRDELGVEPICKALQVAPSTYYAAKRRELSPSARAMRDIVIVQVLMVLWVANRKVYGVRKLWLAARKAGHDIGRTRTRHAVMGVLTAPTRCGSPTSPTSREAWKPSSASTSRSPLHMSSPYDRERERQRRSRCATGLRARAALLRASRAPCTHRLPPR